MIQIESTLTHEEHSKNPYNVLNATKQYNAQAKQYETKASELGKERQSLASSIYNLEAELTTAKGDAVKASMGVLIEDKKKRLREAELNLDAVLAEKEALNISDFMGEGSKAPKPIPAELRRSTMDDAGKVKFIAVHGMSEYLKLRF